MFGYYIQLGIRSLGRSPALTALMVLGIALGISACMTSLTVFHLMGSDPIPAKSALLYHVQIDNWDPNLAFAPPDEPPSQFNYRDATALMDAAKADRQAAMFRAQMPVQPDNRAVKPFLAVGRATGADFFPMFEPPFLYGGPWSKDQDLRHERIVVLSRGTNETLFGGGNSVGRTVRAGDINYTVVGVLGEWRPRVKFFDLVNGTAFADPEEMYLPYTTAIELNLRATGSSACWGNVPAGREAYLASECVWQQFWVELDSPQRVAEYKAFLDAYVIEQKKLGRFPRALNNRLLDVNDWMADQKVVSRDIRVQVGLAFAFLAACLINTIGLLLSKFLRRAGEIGLRRALGASRRQLFAQHLIEAGVVGVSGGLLGLALTWCGLELIRTLDQSLAPVARLDASMIAATAALSIGAALAAGVYPTWRACRVQTALQLKM